jgi:hypothetical protein
VVRGELKNELAFCGTKSGRDCDKARACGLTLKDREPGEAPHKLYFGKVLKAEKLL